MSSETCSDGTDTSLKLSRESNIYKNAEFSSKDRGTLSEDPKVEVYNKEYQLYSSKKLPPNSKHDSNMSDESTDTHFANDEKANAEKEEVKSRAIVKYSAPKPATFTKLQCNTDLNLPPSNWLSSSADSYGLQRVIYRQKGFSRLVF